jgi:hypothetical protein
MCGPAGIRSYSDDKFPTINGYKYFYIHKSNDGKIVVWNDFYQFSNFEKIIYSNLYVQNGGATTLKYSAEMGVEKYVLIIENFKNSGRTFEKTLLCQDLFQLKT